MKTATEKTVETTYKFYLELTGEEAMELNSALDKTLRLSDNEAIDNRGNVVAFTFEQRQLLAELDDMVLTALSR